MMKMPGWVPQLSAWRAGVAVCVLAGCASGPVATGAAPLLLALAPAALGCSVAVQQQLTVHPPSRAAQTLDALLEVDGQAVHLALFHMGQRMGALHWDGQQLQAELSRWWPAQLPPAQVLSDMQLALWPVAAIAQALPAGWQVQETAQGRILSYKGQVRTDVQAAGAGAFDIRYVPAGWSLHVASPGGMQACVSGQEAP